MCLCFIVAKGGSEQTNNVVERQAEEWEGYRTVEVLGWHKQKKVEEVRILFLIHLRNNKVNNTLRIFHPGNVSCDIADLSNGFPLHQDEMGQGTHILETIYGNLLSFDKEKKIFRKQKGLTAWDSLCDIHTEHNETKHKEETKKNIENNEIIVWPEAHTDNKWFINPLFKFAEETKFSPFSAWEFGPFEKKAEYLVALYVTVRGASYREFVKKGPFFVVDGPKRLRDRIKYWYISNLPRNEQKKWQKRLSEFEEYLPFNESYDVVTLGEPLADRVIADMDGSTLITEGVLCLTPDRPFKRYITTDSSFKLRLSYEDGLFKDRREISFTKNRHSIPLLMSQI